jgi:penicillin amidase
VKTLRLVVSLLLSALAFWGLNQRHGLLPPLGKLLNPFAGFWLNGDDGDRPPAHLSVPGLGSEVRIAWDERRVPHVFAADDHDLYFAQGYITARDRLWQMEFQTRYAAGRIAEVVGPRALALDRFRRRFGMVWAAEKSVQAIESDPVARSVIEAYTSGINAFIRGLGPRSYPVEYKILDYRPEPWTPLKCALLLKFMSFDLAGYYSDPDLTEMRQALGEAFVDKLFPYEEPLVDPIIPPGTPWDFKPIPVPPVPSQTAAPARVEPGALSSPDELDESRGSNNWAVAGTRTRSGYPILCNDPHLSLTLPSIWYEIQLSAPGVNVAGVSLPGAPFIVIGHNERIAWGFTNAGSDVLDWYAIRFKDRSRSEYWYDGSWLPSERRRETIKVRGGPDVVETLIITRHGPVVRLAGEAPFAERDVPAEAALRWLAHDPSNELRTLYDLNRAGGYDEWLKAIAGWSCPAQNFIYADAAGTIAIRHNGLFPLRWKGQGRYILDGSNPAHDWQGWVPRNQIPAVKNPARGFVSSANQKPTDASYPYYLGSDYESFERGTRVNQLLDGMTDVTPQDMIRMQNDAFNLRAWTVLPALLPCLRRSGLTEVERESLAELESWDGQNLAGLVAPTVFAQFWFELNVKTWNDEEKPPMRTMPWPNSQVLVNLILHHPEDPLFDDKTTPGRETLPEIAVLAFRSAVGALEKTLGPPGPAWTWGRWKGTDIRHLGQLPGFGRIGLPTNGGSAIINASGKVSGPSWRMVVELGPAVKAWGIIPGGESGSPGSKFYDNGVDDWVAGKIYELVFLKSADEPDPRIVARTTLGGSK